LVPGTIALAVAPVQYWLGYSSRHRAWHRALGRTYITCVLLSSGPAVALALTNTISWVYGLGVLGLAAAWLLTTGMAWRAARNRRFDQHRDWMIRSMVVTFGFVWFRVAHAVAAVLGVGTEAERFIVAAWASWSVPLLIAEVLLQRARGTARSNVISASGYTVDQRPRGSQEGSSLSSTTAQR
jgi:Predicted membrane protein (DUF2306)